MHSPAHAIFLYLSCMQVAIDNYQALYRPSEYGQWLSQHKRRSIDPSELRVASSMQLLDKPKPLKNGVVVCASSRSGQYSPKMKVNLFAAMTLE